MSDQVVITMTAKDAEMVAAWQKARGNVQQFEQAVTRAAGKTKELGKDGAMSFGELANAGAGVLSIMGGLTTAAGLFKRELDEINAKQERIAGRQINIASSFRRAASVGRELSPDSIYQQVSKAANSQQMANDLMLSFEAATSAAGPTLSGQDILDAVLETAKQRPDLDQSARTALATGALQLQKTFGGDVSTAMAAVQQSFGTSRAENLGAFSTNAIPTATTLSTMFGGKDDFQKLMGLVVGFGQATNDPTHERTRTDLIGLAKQIKEQAMGRGLANADAGLFEMLTALQGDKRAQSELLGVFAQATTGQSSAAVKRDIKKGTLSAGAASFQAATELISGQGATVKAVADATAANRGLTPAAVAEIAAKQEEIRNARALTTPIAAEDRERVLTASELNSTAGIRAEARKTATAIWERLPISAAKIIDRYIGAGIGQEIITGPFQTDVQYVRGTESNLRQSMIAQGVQPTAEITALLKTLSDAADKLAEGQRQDEVAKLLREQNAMMKEQAAGRAPRRAPIQGAGDQR